MSARPIAPRLGPWYGRVGLAATIAFLGVGLVLVVGDRPAAAVAGALVALGAAAALFLWESRLSLLHASVCAIGVTVMANGNPADVGWFALCLVAGWCALRAGPVGGGSFLGAILVIFGAEWLFSVQDVGWAPWAAGTTLTVLAALLVRRQLVLVEQLRALQADLAARSRAEERNRIARELHDVIAHTLTVSLLHVSSARLAVEHDPEDAARALADAERLTRQSLDEVRTTVGLLRQAGDDAIAPPAPAIDDLGGLVADLRAAQEDVALELDGDFDGIPATTATAVYRIVQESLTNASRHAAGAPVRVRVVARPDRVDVSVDSAGAPGRGAGMGLANMRERAEAVGGTCTAGPGGRGWLVQASLPRVAPSNGSVR